ncbi:MAG TPA: hypothetical protein VJ872_01250 [Nocardioides sp.]|nr:hypothetical protein [Nocardioides sp.]
MAPTSRHSPLRIEIPTLDPDDVLLERLAAASVVSTPSPGTPWLIGLRAALVAVVVALLGATTWAAGALAGVDTPFRHREIMHAPMVPTTPAGVTGSPQSGDSSSGSPAAPGLPDEPGRAAKGHAHSKSAAHRHGTHSAPRRGTGPGPITTEPWPGFGDGHHFGWGKNRGRHLGARPEPRHIG